jgi:hypothetical protein
MTTITTRPITNMPSKFVTLCPAGDAYLAGLPPRSLFMSWDGSRRHGYVSIYEPMVAGEMQTLARRIAGARKGERVRYRNRDVTDLRLSNLMVERGGAKGQSPNPRRPGSEF